MNLGISSILLVFLVIIMNLANSAYFNKDDLLQKRISNFHLQVLIGVMFGVSIVSAYLLFSESGFFEISRFDWLSTNCQDFAQNWSLSGTIIDQGDDYYEDVYGQCSDEKFASLMNSLILIGSVSIAIISWYFLQKTSNKADKSSEIETISPKGSETTQTHEQSSDQTTTNDEVSSHDLTTKKTASGNMIEEQDSNSVVQPKEAEKPIHKPTNSSPISPIGPIEFDSEGYEWSTDRYERSIYRVAGSADHWNIWE